MKRLTGLAALGLVLALAGTATAGDYARWQMLDGRRGYTHREVRLTIRDAADRYNVPFRRVLDIAERESGLNEKAWNESSGACGVFQQLHHYWAGRRNHHNRVSPGPWGVGRRAGCKSARANVLVSVRMMGQGLWYHWE